MSASVETNNKENAQAAAGPAPKSESRKSGSTASAKAEYAKSARATCPKCKEKIAQGALRINFHNANYHPQCFNEDFTFTQPADELHEFDALKDEDKKLLRNIFNGQDESSRKRVNETGDEAADAKKPKLDDSEQQQETAPAEEEQQPKGESGGAADVDVSTAKEEEPDAVDGQPEEEKPSEAKEDGEIGNEA